MRVSRDEYKQINTGVVFYLFVCFACQKIPLQTVNGAHTFFFEEEENIQIFSWFAFLLKKFMIFLLAVVVIYK